MTPIPEAPPNALVCSKDFTNDERLTLSRSWASVLNVAANNSVTLSGDQLKDLTTDASKLFWLLVHSEYLGRNPPRQRTIQQLQCEWEKIRPSLTQFLKLFEQKWTESRFQAPDESYRRKEALHWAMMEFLQRFGSYFLYLEIASKLTFHEKFWSVLCPMLLREEVTQLSRGVVRQRVEDEEDSEDRRVKRRVDSSLQLLLQAQPMVMPTTNEADKKKAEVLERRLEMELMTKSEEGLSSDAVEYVRLQRQQILGQLREKNGLTAVNDDTAGDTRADFNFDSNVNAVDDADEDINDNVKSATNGDTSGDTTETMACVSELDRSDVAKESLEDTSRRISRRNSF